MTRMVPRPWRFAMVFAVLSLQACRGPSPQSGEQAEDIGDGLRRDYEKFAAALKVERFREGYPALIAKLAAPDRETRSTALRTIAESGETDAIPLIVDVILSEEDRSVRIWAGHALQKIVTANELKRRDPEHPEKVVILPRRPGDIDLRPLAWVCRQMLAMPDDGSTHAYAAHMISYLDLKEFEPDLRALLESRHPAVTRSAVNALRTMGFVVEIEPHPLERWYRR